MKDLIIKVVKAENSCTSRGYCKEETMASSENTGCGCGNEEMMTVDESSSSPFDDDDDDEEEDFTIPTRRLNSSKNQKKRSTAAAAAASAFRDDDDDDDFDVGRLHRNSITRNNARDNSNAESGLLEDSDDDDDDEEDDNAINCLESSTWFQLEPDELRGKLVRYTNGVDTHHRLTKTQKAKDKMNRTKIQAVLKLDSYWQHWIEKKLVIAQPQHRSRNNGRPPQRLGRSVIEKWNNDYEDDHNEMEMDGSSSNNSINGNAIFQPPLQYADCGIVVQPSMEMRPPWFSSQQPRKTYELLERMLEIYNDDNYEFLIGWSKHDSTADEDRDQNNGNRDNITPDCYCWEPLIVPWVDNDDSVPSFTPRTFLAKLGANNNEQSLQNCKIAIRAWVFNDDHLDPAHHRRHRHHHADGSIDDEQIRLLQRNKLGLQAIQDFLDQYENSYVFTIGDDVQKLNPVPCFAVAHVPNQNLVVGFIGGY